MQKRTATGAQIGIVHNINWLYQNSTFLTYPSAYTTNIQMTLTQPLLGSAPLPGQPVNNFSNLVGLEANRAPIVIARLQADESVWSFKLNVMELVRSIEQQYWILARKHVQLWSSEKAVDLAREILSRENAELVVGKGTRRRRGRSPAAAGTVQPGSGDADFRPDHHRAAAPQPARPAAG